jgi:hypothetical protein
MGVVVSEDLAYLASWEDGLRIVDISTPAAPAHVGACDTPGLAYGVTVAESYAYLADYREGLRIVDVSNPAAPAEVGFLDTPGPAWNVALVETHAYVADGDGGLRIINVSNPAAPVELGFHDTAGYARDVTVVGDYAYIADCKGGLRIVDISNPVNPTEIGSYDASGCVASITVAGNWAYVGGGDPDMQFLDVSNPAVPRRVGHYSATGYAFSVSLANGYTYIADGSGGLSILQFRFTPISVVIPASGGSFTSHADHTEYVFPSGTFTDTVIVTHVAYPDDSAPAPSKLTGISHAFAVTAVYSNTDSATLSLPAQIVPGHPYTIVIKYTDVEKGPAIEDSLDLYAWNGSAWSQQGIASSVNVTDNLITAGVDHLSLFAVLGETQRVFLPLISKDN